MPHQLPLKYPKEDYTSLQAFLPYDLRCRYKLELWFNKLITKTSNLIALFSSHILDMCSSPMSMCKRTGYQTKPHVLVLSGWKIVYLPPWFYQDTKLSTFKRPDYFSAPLLASNYTIRHNKTCNRE